MLMSKIENFNFFQKNFRPHALGEALAVGAAVIIDVNQTKNNQKRGKSENIEDLLIYDLWFTIFDCPYIRHKMTIAPRSRRSRRLWFVSRSSWIVSRKYRTWPDLSTPLHFAQDDKSGDDSYVVSRMSYVVCPFHWLMTNDSVFSVSSVAMIRMSHSTALRAG